MRDYQELTFYQLAFIFISRWRLFVSVGFLFLIFAFGKSFLFPEFTGTGKLIIKDFNNSQLQLSLIQVANPDEEKKSTLNNTDEANLQTEVLLNSHFFYTELAKKISYSNQFRKNEFPVELFGISKNSKDNQDNILIMADHLKMLVTFQKIKSNVITVESKTSSRELSAFLVNQSLIVAKEQIIQRELDELNLAEKYFSDELRNKREAISQIEHRTLSKMSGKQIYSFTSEKSDSVGYINELRRSINNIKIEMMTNSNKIEEYESLAKNGGEGENKYTYANQLRSYKDQNSALQLRLKALGNFLKEYETNKNKLLPLEYEIENQNALHQLEYKIFESIKESLAKISLQKIYVQNKISIVEFERPSHLHSSPSLLLLVLGSQAISLCLCFFGIFVYELILSEQRMSSSHNFRDALA